MSNFVVPQAMQAAPVLPSNTAFDDASLIDGRDSAAAAAMSLSKFHDMVANGLAPAPVVKGVRFTRWRKGDIRAWLQQLADGTVDVSGATARASKQAVPA